MIGFAMCGSFCTHKASIIELERLVSCGIDVLPIMSEIVYTTSTRFGEATKLIERPNVIVTSTASVAVAICNTND